MGRGRRVNHQALGVADVREMAEQPHAVDEAARGLQPSADAEADDGAGAACEVAVDTRTVGVPQEAGVVHPRHLGMRGEPQRDFRRVRAVGGDPDGKRFEALQEQERVEGRQAGAEVAQQLHARLGDERGARRNRPLVRAEIGRAHV
jgi:hypothetical protein